MLSYLALLPAAYAWQQRPLYSDYSFNPLEHLAGIAPYYEPNDPPRDPLPPQGCSVTQAAYLVRHAAINANSFDYETYLETFKSNVDEFLSALVGIRGPMHQTGSFKLSLKISNPNGSISSTV
jgi:hypothetical protein